MVAWIDELRHTKGWGDDDPLFPATKVGLNAERFAAVGLKRAVWANADPIRKIFRRAFEAAGQPRFNPHSFRKTLARLGEQICQTPEEFKAWSQNLGHEPGRRLSRITERWYCIDKARLCSRVPAGERRARATTEERLARIEALLSRGQTES